MNVLFEQDCEFLQLQEELRTMELNIMFAVFMFRMQYPTATLLCGETIIQWAAGDDYDDRQLAVMAIRELRATGDIGIVDVEADQGEPNEFGVVKRMTMWSEQLLENEELCERVVMELPESAPVIWLTV